MSRYPRPLVPVRLLYTAAYDPDFCIADLVIRMIYDSAYDPGSQQYQENQPLEFYCEECKVPICNKCSVVSHNRHTMTDTQQAGQVQKMQVKDGLEKVKANKETNRVNGQEQKRNFVLRKEDDRFSGRIDS